jgi:hypothetical protein
MILIINQDFFSSSVMLWTNKLECLPLVQPFSLV